MGQSISHLKHNVYPHKLQSYLIITGILIFIFIAYIFLRVKPLFAPQKKVTAVFIKKVNKQTKSGEFTIIHPSNQPFPKTEKQILFNGSYDIGTHKVELVPQIIGSNITDYRSPLLIHNSSILLQMLIISPQNETEELFNTVIAVTPDKLQTTIPFQIRMPYFQSFVLKILNQQTKELLYTQKITL